MVLNNGTHRAYALRAAGITRIPCVVQAIEHPDELAYAGGTELTEDYLALFQSPRPPLFKDFFDPNLAFEFDAAKTTRQIEISIDVKTVRIRQ